MSDRALRRQCHVPNSVQTLSKCKWNCNENVRDMEAVWVALGDGLHM